MSSSEVVCYDSPQLLVDTALLTTSGRVRVRYHETQALRAIETRVLCPADPRYEAIALLPPNLPVGQINLPARGSTATTSS